MSRRYQFIVIVVFAALLLAPASAWAGPGPAGRTFVADSFTISDWLSVAWTQARQVLLPSYTLKTSPQPPQDEPEPKYTETGASSDPWG